jgi:transcriptional regulator with XRE-family HTH domain
MVNERNDWPTPHLLRAARGLIGISQETLAKDVGVTQKTIAKIEADGSKSDDPRRQKVLQELQRVLEVEYGIEFFAASENSGEGVRFRKK